MPRFTSPDNTQRFLAANGPITPYVRPRRHRLSAPACRQELGQRLQVWREGTAWAPAAYVLIGGQLSTCRPGPAWQHIDLTMPVGERGIDGDHAGTSEVGRRGRGLASGNGGPGG